MGLRVERVDQRRVNTNSYVAATFTFSGAAGQPPTSRLYVGRLQDVIVVQIGSQRRVLLSVRWFREMDEDQRLHLCRFTTYGNFIYYSTYASFILVPSVVQPDP